MLTSNLVSTGASPAADEPTTRNAEPRLNSAAALKVTTFVAFKMSRLAIDKASTRDRYHICALDFHKSKELLLLEVGPNSEVVMPRTNVRRETVVIYGFLGRHGRGRHGWVMME